MAGGATGNAGDSRAQRNPATASPFGDFKPMQPPQPSDFRQQVGAPSFNFEEPQLGKPYMGVGAFGGAAPAPSMTYDKAIGLNMQQDIKPPHIQAQIDAAIAGGPTQATTSEIKHDPYHANPQRHMLDRMPRFPYMPMMGGFGAPYGMMPMMPYGMGGFGSPYGMGGFGSPYGMGGFRPSPFGPQMQAQAAYQSAQQAGGAVPRGLGAQQAINRGDLQAATLMRGFSF